MLTANPFLAFLLIVGVVSVPLISFARVYFFQEEVLARQLKRVNVTLKRRRSERQKSVGEVVPMDEIETEYKAQYKTLVTVLAVAIAFVLVGLSKLMWSVFVGILAIGLIVLGVILATRKLTEVLEVAWPKLTKLFTK